MNLFRALLIPLALAGAACGSALTANDHVAPEVPLWYNRPNGAIDLVFRRVITAPSRKVGEEYERGRPEIDSARGRLFVGSSDKGLYALRATDGSTIWRFETMGAVQSEPYYDRDLDVVFFGSHDGALYAVRAQDGGLLFRYETGAEVARRPERRGEVLYFANAADQLFAIDRRTGSTKWKVARPSALGMEVAGHAGPTIDNGKVYFAFSDGHVSAFDAKDGHEVWSPVDLTAEAEQVRGTTEQSKYLDVDTTPTLIEIAGKRPTKVVIVASYAGGLFALDSETGNRIWANTEATGITDVIAWSEPAHTSSVANGETIIPQRTIIVASSATTGLWGVEPVNGREIWRDKLPLGGLTSPVQVGGAIAVGTTKYGVFLIAPRNGRVIDGVDVGTGFSQSPAAYGSKLYIMSNAGTLLGLNIEAPIPPESTTRWLW